MKTLILTMITPLLALFRPAPKPRVEFCNIAAGTHEGLVTRLTDAAITTRFLIMKAGSDAAHMAVCAAVTDVPMGVAYDEATAAEENISIQLLGGRSSTILVTAGAAITAGALVATDANAKAQTAVATQYPIGRALTSASGDGDVIEVDPVVPTQVLS